MSLAAGFASRVYPINPTGPTRAPAGFVTPATILQDVSPPLDFQALEAMRHKFVEIVLRSIVLAIRNFLGIDLPSEQLSKFFNNLITFLADVDFFDEAFKLGANARKFAKDVLIQTRHFFSGNIINSAITNGGFPYGFGTGLFHDGIIFPDGNSIKRYIRNLHTALDLPDIGEIGANALNLVQVIMDKLNVQGMIDNIINAIEFFGEILTNTNPVGTVLDSFVNVMNSILGIGKHGVALEERIALLEGASVTILDDFNRSSSSSLGSNWDVIATGSGAGSLGLDGSGNATWKKSGTGNRTNIVRYNDHGLGTDRGVLSVITGSSWETELTTNSQLYLCCRFHASNNTYMRVRINRTGLTTCSAQLQAVVSGTVTNVGSSASLPRIVSGDRLDFYFGSASNDYNFILERNGQEELNVTDGSALVTVGATQRYIGFGMTADGSLLTTQNAPPRIAVITAVGIL